VQANVVQLDSLAYDYLINGHLATRESNFKPLRLIPLQFLIQDQPALIISPNVEGLWRPSAFFCIRVVIVGRYPIVEVVQMDFLVEVN
jgi:hypothetical protein